MIDLTADEIRAGLGRVRAHKARASLYEFTKQAWEIVEPAMPFRDNWHIGAICEHLEAVSKSEIKRLLINIPPGHAKSLLVCVLWPAWVWTWRPTWRSLFTAYAADLATRDSSKCRTLMETVWYQSSFVRGPDNVALWEFKDDSNRKHDYSNTASGRRLASSPDGKNTGERGDAVVVDDPLSAKDAPSKAARDSVIYWWDRVMSSRLNDMENGARVIIMQRLHEEDLSGHVLDRGGYEHLCLPSEYDPRRRSITFATRNGVKGKFFADPRKETGDLLFPSLFPESVIAQAKIDLGAGYAGQHDQRPSAEEGELFKRQWWRFWRTEGTGQARARPPGCTDAPAVLLPKLDRVIISLDATFKGGTNSDYVVFTVWGTYKAERYLLDMARGQWTFTETIAQFRALVVKWPQARKKLVENKANGSAIMDVLRSEIPGIISVNPEGGKESRASAMQPTVQAEQAFLPEGAPWLGILIDEFAAFPKGKHDDIVDSSSQAIIELGLSSNAGRIRAMGKM